MDPNHHHPAAPASSATIAQCDECGAPVDEEQRYCVDCGAHRRHVADPAARYLSQATARSRTTRAAATARRSPRSGPGRVGGLGIAVAIALIPAAAAVGVLAGRSSNNDDAKLINALAREQSAASRVAAAGGTATTVANVPHHSGSTSAGHGTGTKAGGEKHKTATHKRHHHAASSTKSTSSGATAISTAPPTAAQKQTGAQDTEKVQKSKGKSYVHQQSSLPGTVVVP